MDERDRFRGCLLGLACGDAVGTAVEFSARGQFAPVTDMVGGGVFGLKPGEWTDDTSMALCLATSLVELGRFDPADQMRRYWRWVDDGYLSSNGRCFDVGNTVYDALERFRQTGEPLSGSTDPWSAGNGCIMRLAPVPMFFYPDREQVIEMSGQSARTTHAAAECIEACRLLGGILFRALAGASKAEALFDHGVTGLVCETIQTIAQGDYRSKSEGQISGSGYVVRSLEAALWCFWQATDFRDAVLRAVNLGDDADTTAAVCGQVAGAHHGESGIPEHWLARLVMCDEIRGLADRLWLKNRPAEPFSGL
jgi:ADP-ribosyl-[dinitrogen reductase] hydrolase